MTLPQRQTVLGGWRVGLYDRDPPVLKFEHEHASFEVALDWHGIQQVEKTLIHAEALIRRREVGAESGEGEERDE